MVTKTKTGRIMQLSNSLLITLPIDFVRKSGLKKGDVVGLTYDSILVIVTPKQIK